MKALKGSHFREKHGFSPEWQGAPDAWNELIEKLCEDMQFLDAPWEYPEETLSGILAKALMTTGISVIQEVDVERKNSKNGKVDICIVKRDRDITKIELIECKMAEFDAIRSKKKSDGKLAKAFDQVKNIRWI